MPRKPTETSKLKRRADDLFRSIVRERGRCERCGASGGLEVAHMIRRRYSAVRCVESNAWLLCWKCHQLVDGSAVHLAELVANTIGLEQYEANWQLARGGLLVSYLNFWRSEVERLEARCDELGVRRPQRRSA